MTNCEKKTRFKMYKAKKGWIIAGVTLFSAGLIGFSAQTESASASTEPTTEQVATVAVGTSTTSNVETADESPVQSVSSEVTETATEASQTTGNSNHSGTTTADQSTIVETTPTPENSTETEKSGVAETPTNLEAEAPVSSNTTEVADAVVASDVEANTEVQSSVDTAHSDTDNDQNVEMESVNSTMDTSTEIKSATARITVVPDEALFTINDEGVITEFDNSEGYQDIKIPNVIRDIEVLGIADEAFKRKNLISVVIPEGVTYIGESAFEDNELITVSIPKSIREIGDNAFKDNQLIEVEILETSGETYQFGEGIFANNELQVLSSPVALYGNFQNYGNFTADPEFSFALDGNFITLTVGGEMQVGSVEVLDSGVIFENDVFRVTDPTLDSFSFIATYRDSGGNVQFQRTISVFLGVLIARDITRTVGNTDNLSTEDFIVSISIPNIEDPLSHVSSNLDELDLTKPGVYKITIKAYDNMLSADAWLTLVAPGGRTTPTPPVVIPPVEPETPITPEVPTIPEAPETPATPESPVVPGNSEISTSPGSAGTAESSGEDSGTTTAGPSMIFAHTGGTSSQSTSNTTNEQDKQIKASGVKKVVKASILPQTNDGQTNSFTMIGVLMFLVGLLGFRRKRKE
ncbi:leucine-rich repeat protein [Secundilactobacillus malefermentans]|uniref:leucine-rich repeat protein n=1 Tax=Secundilactobacillus malefermentans TaxID=176292 RepID=UPI00164FE98D|nr:leucine-rich repeat protein [Secundilactobacillus malefermentans]